MKKKFNVKYLLQISLLTFLISWAIISAWFYLLGEYKDIFIDDPSFNFINDVVLSPLSLAVPLANTLIVMVIGGYDEMKKLKKI